MKGLNLIFLVVGIALAAGGHLHWVISRMSSSNKLADVMLVVPGWSLIAMGYLGALLAATRQVRQEERAE